MAVRIADRAKVTPFMVKTSYNNGAITKFFIRGTEPTGWVLGSLMVGENHPLYGLPEAATDKKWYNDGTEDKYFYDGTQPEG